MRVPLVSPIGTKIQDGYGLRDPDFERIKRADRAWGLEKEDEELRKQSIRKSSGSASGEKKFGIKINGKLWKKEGKAVSFATRSAAERAANGGALAAKETEVVPLTENAELIGLGKSLAGITVSKPAAKAEPEAKVEPAAKTDEKSAGFKVGQKVKTLVGPHKGEVHEVTKVNADGTLNISPVSLKGDEVKYKGGQAKAKPEQLQLAESLNLTGKSLLAQVHQIVEAKTKELEIEAYGVKGMKSTPWRKTFKNQAAFEKWLEANEGNVEVHGSREVEAAK